MKKLIYKDKYREFNIYAYDDGTFAVAPCKLPLLKIKKGLYDRLSCMALIDTCYLRAAAKKRDK